MLIELIDQFRVRVILDDPDMEALGISYADLLFGTDTLGPALRQLLLRVCTQTGFDPRQRKLLIEVYPGETGGCILYFSALNPMSASSSTNTSSGSSTSPARYRIKERNIAPYFSAFRMRTLSSLRRCPPLTLSTKRFPLLDGRPHYRFDSRLVHRCENSRYAHYVYRQSRPYFSSARFDYEA